METEPELIRRFGGVAPLTNARVCDIERAIGFDFPREFREFALEFNGGTPVRRRLLDGFPMNVSAFLYFSKNNDGEDLILDEVIEQFREQIRIGFFPFAHDDSGLKYLFVEKETGKIYGGWGRDARTRSALHLVADGIRDLTSKLR